MMQKVILARQFSMEQSQSQVPIIREGLYLSGLFRNALREGGAKNLAVKVMRGKKSISEDEVEEDE
jgi:hypothetical protein